MTQVISLRQVADALIAYPAYRAVDIFIDNLQEAEALANDTAPGVVVISDTRATFSHSGSNFVMDVLPGGIARIARHAGPGSPVAGAVIGGAVGAALGQAADAKKGASTGLLLGLLIGGALGAGAAAPQRVFTLRWNPATQSWQAYDGGLVRWMKQTMNPT